MQMADALAVEVSEPWISKGFSSPSRATPSKYTRLNTSQHAV
jgi:hypothetical protein